MKNDKSKTHVRRWGNSIGIRVPASILKDAKLEIDDLVNIEIKGNAIIIKKEN